MREAVIEWPVPQIVLDRQDQSAPTSITPHLRREYDPGNALSQSCDAPILFGTVRLHVLRVKIRKQLIRDDQNSTLVGENQLTLLLALHLFWGLPPLPLPSPINNVWMNALLALQSFFPYESAIKLVRRRPSALIWTCYVLEKGYLYPDPANADRPMLCPALSCPTLPRYAMHLETRTST